MTILLIGRTLAKFHFFNNSGAIYHVHSIASVENDVPILISGIKKKAHYSTIIKAVNKLNHTLNHTHKSRNK